MRVAAIRSDIQKIYVNDIENRAQRCFSSEPAGQSRYFVKPISAQIEAVLTANAPATLLGSNTAATVDTSASGDNELLITDLATKAHVTVTVTAGAAVTKATVAADLNTAFATAGLKLSARVAASNKIAIDTTAGNLGPSAYIDVNASGLATVLGLSTTAVTGVATATVEAAIYPSASTVVCDTATIGGISGYTNMATATLAALTLALQDLVAPSLVETGPVLLSFSYGNLHGFSDSAFQPGGTRSGLPAGAAVYCLLEDGSGPFTL